MKRYIILLIMGVVFAQTIHADPKLVLQSKDWQVFQFTQDGKKVCYAATEAADKKPNAAKHGRVFFFISNWQGGTKNQPSVLVGYDFRSNSTPKVSIGKKTWTLFPAGNEAFALDNDDSAIVSSAKRGTSLRVEGTSARGTQVIYNFSLSGSSRAIARAVELCS